MIVNRPPAETPPACYNRPPAHPYYVRHVLNEQTGQVEPIEIRMDWAKPGCATIRGVGIGQPTEEYPAGTPYHVAHGFAEWCAKCRHMPEEYR